MFTITKDFMFSASHQLDHLEPGHKCRRLHGHNYVARVRVSAYRLDCRGMVIDYAQLAPLGQYLDEQFDHQHLNDVLSFPPTAEHLAQHLHGIAVQLLDPLAHDIQLAVAVSETPRTWAEYTP